MMRAFWLVQLLLRGLQVSTITGERVVLGTVVFGVSVWALLMLRALCLVQLLLEALLRHEYGQGHYLLANVPT